MVPKNLQLSALIKLLLDATFRDGHTLEITSPVLQDPGGSSHFPQQATTEYGPGDREEVLAPTAYTWNIHANVRGVALVRGVQDLVRIPDRYFMVPSNLRAYRQDLEKFDIPNARIERRGQLHLSVPSLFT